MDADGCYAEPRHSVPNDFPPFLAFNCAPPVVGWPPFLPAFTHPPDKDFSTFVPQFHPDALKKLVEFDWTQAFSQVAFQFPQHSLYGEMMPGNNHSGEKYIGTLTTEQRRERVLRFLDKRKRRSFAKKISYHCRKKVADRRIRVKGRFVTTEQAAALHQASLSSSCA